jgi:hypothetical protein
VLGELARGPDICELDPRGLNLPRPETRRGKTAIGFYPRAGVGIDPLRHRLTALGAIDDHHAGRLALIPIRQLLDQ